MTTATSHNGRASVAVRDQALRRRGVDRTQEVARAARECFSEGGFRLTQIAHVSERLGVSVGTIYRYVESKEALFHLAVLDAAEALPNSLVLPVKVAGASDTVAVLQGLIAKDPLWPVLRAAVEAPTPIDPKAEAMAIALELFDTITAGAALISLLDRCANDIPELSDVFDHQIRRQLMDGLEAWARRCDATADRNRTNVSALARGAMEAVVWLAKSRRRDPTARTISEVDARDAAMRIFANAFD
jgi:AcrR family transcriptional regulator